MRSFIIILWLILGIIYWWIWDSRVDTCCDGKDKNKIENTQKKSTTKAVTTAKLLTKSSLPLAFIWGKSGTVVGDGFKAYKDSLVGKLKKNEKFEIIGYYHSEEVNNTKFENLGLARANETRKLFPELPDNRIKLSGKLIQRQPKDKNIAYESTSFNYIIDNPNIKKVGDDKVLIYFPYNSSNKKDSKKIEAYLDDVAKRVTKSGETVILTGHTDSVGNDDYNYKLALKRVNKIKNYLISKGVAANKVKAMSKGEKEPIATNDTPEGRSKNRRVELIIK